MYAVRRALNAAAPVLSPSRKAVGVQCFLDLGRQCSSDCERGPPHFPRKMTKTEYKPAYHGDP